MAQQINLYSPILLTTKRYFSAVAMAQALIAIAVGTVALCAWTTLQTRNLREALQTTQRGYAAEKQSLIAAIAAHPASGASTTSLEQGLHAAQQSLSQREQVLEELTRGTLLEGRSHSAMLRMVAETVPAPVWLTEVRMNSGRLEVTGLTLDPGALRPWIASLAVNALLAGQPLATVRVERASPSAAGQSLPPGVPKSSGGLEAWSFTLASGTEPLSAKPVVAASSTPTADGYAAAAIAYAAAVAASANAQARTGAQP